MEKLVYLLWRDVSLDSDGFSKSLLSDLDPGLRSGGARNIAINVVDAHVAASGAAPMTHLDPAPAAMVTFWLNNSDDRQDCEEALLRHSSDIAGYLVVESVPLANTSHRARQGQRSLGINVIALIECPPAMDLGQWIEHWRGHHKRVALKTQCTYEYIRNEVVRRLTSSGPFFNAIVEEGFPEEAFKDPMVWYQAEGDKEKFEENFGLMMESVNAFLDINRVETHPMSQYVLDEEQ